MHRAFAELARVITRSGQVVVGIGDPAMMTRMPTTHFRFTIRKVDEIVSLATSAELVLLDHRRVGDGEDAAHLLAFAHSP